MSIGSVEQVVWSGKIKLFWLTAERWPGVVGGPNDVDCRRELVLSRMNRSRNRLSACQVPQNHFNTSVFKVRGLLLRGVKLLGGKTPTDEFVLRSCQHEPKACQNALAISCSWNTRDKTTIPRTASAGASSLGGLLCSNQLWRSGRAECDP